ncbi:hypothetical protein RclHR1_24310002 [Rhizophagus clarus]|uniref:Uncharacterized protein n=1 Tax=Rhizophagus clarus TaxID=94130 RepID=A0A2Z6RRR2_9GLOM|nr:hypothetical protein RclHR1_24310002 [Rhizophagus clarus]
MPKLITAYFYRRNAETVINSRRSIVEVLIGVLIHEPDFSERSAGRITIYEPDINERNARRIGIHEPVFEKILPDELYELVFE